MSTLATYRFRVETSAGALPFPTAKLRGRLPSFGRYKGFKGYKFGRYSFETFPMPNEPQRRGVPSFKLGAWRAERMESGRYCDHLLSIVRVDKSYPRYKSFP